MRLLDLLEWLKQIFGESLGKEGRGIMPNLGLGPQDQHTMLQYYLDGPNDCFFNFINVKPKQTSKLFAAENISLANKSLEEIHEALFLGTVKSLEAAGRSVRVLEISELNEASLAELMMFFASEVVLTARLLNVNPFDQPGVEKIKIFTKELLNV
jgi:glucose-6-phosphate isomerase